MAISDILGKIKGIKNKIPFLGKGEEEPSEDLSLDGDLGGDLSLEEPGAAVGAEPEAEPEIEPEPAPEPRPEPEPESPAPSASSTHHQIDDLKTRMSNLSEKFEGLHTEIDTVQSESEFEQSLLKRYEYYLKSMAEKIDLLERQHRSLWDELKKRKKKP